MRRRACTLIFILIPFVIVGCATPDGMNRQQAGTGWGAAVGAVIGAAVNKKDRKKGALVGALLGGLAGNLIGKHLDEQEKRLRANMQREIADGNVALTRTEDREAMVLSMNGTLLFDSGKSSLKPSAYPVLDRLIAGWQQNPDVSVAINGHTDNVGSLSFNRDLSLRRANTVAAYLVNHGIPYERLYIRGAGELAPIADNNSPAGRAKNRRVDLVFYPANIEPPEIVPLLTADTEPADRAAKKRKPPSPPLKTTSPERIYAFDENARASAKQKQKAIEQKENTDPVTPIRPASELIKHV